MSLYHSSTVRMIGGLKGRASRRVVGDSFEEMLSVSRESPESTVINRPPIGVSSWKSRSLPMLRVDEDRVDILEKYESSEVSEAHILVLTWILRRDMYFDRHKRDEKIEDFFKVGIRGSTIDLLKGGNWIDDPWNDGLKKLNAKVEKIDLGRRSDLNYSSYQSPESLERYDRDANRKDLVEPEEADKEYIKSNAILRESLRKRKPWMASKWIDLYGI